MKIGVTGASGHIGNLLCKELVSRGYQVRALVHKNDIPKNISHLEIFRGDITDRQGVRKFTEGLHAVYHLAAKISIQKDLDGSVMKTNIEGTSNIVNGCLENGVQKLLHFSSIHAYDPFPQKEVLDETRAFVGPFAADYDRSKAISEQIVLSGMKRGLRPIILSPTGVIGPYDYAPSFLGKAFLSLYREKLFALTEGGFDFVDIRDVVQSSIMALKKGQVGERYLLSGRWISAKDLMHSAAKIAYKKPPFLKVPAWVAKMALPFVSLQAKIKNSPPLYTKESIDTLKNSHQNISHAKARKVLGHKARPIEETLRDTYTFFSQEFSC